MPTAAVTSEVPATAKATHMAAAKSRVMPFAKVMVFPGMVDGETRRIATRVVWPSVGIGGIAIAWIAIVAISRFATSAHPKTE
jgi:hypothetical protein